MNTIIEKVFFTPSDTIACFTNDIRDQINKTGRSKLGSITIESVELGFGHSFSASIKTSVPINKLKGLSVAFDD